MFNSVKLYLLQFSDFLFTKLGIRLTTGVTTALRGVRANGEVCHVLIFILIYLCNMKLNTQCGKRSAV